MLAKKAKLPTGEFRSKHYRAVTTPFFSIKVKENKEGHGRIGVVAGAAVAKNAAKRNFLKRQVKTTLFQNTKRNIGKDFLVILSPKIKSLTKKQIKNAILAAAGRSRGEV